ncbi:MAG: ABC transporter permease, partial [Alicyclobacillus sp.]|nr:ABC transporter permease [Alicyclobacillus sp.]
DVAVIIPPDYTARIQAMRPAHVAVEAPLRNSTKSGVVAAVIDQFGKQAALARFLSEHRLPDGRLPELPPGQVVVRSPGLHPVTAGSYYAVGMMTMFTLMAALHRSTALLAERKGDRFKRLLVAPCSQLALVTSYFGSNALILFGQAGLLLSADRLLLNVRLGPWPQVVVLLAAYCFALAGLSLALGIWIDNLGVLNGLANVGSQMAAGLGGSIYPIYAFPKALQWVGRALPNGQALNGLLDSLEGTATSQLWTPVLCLVCLGLCAGVVAGLRRWRTAA